MVGSACTPNVDLAKAAGIEFDRGIMVNRVRETSSPGVFAAGDIARWPDPHTGKSDQGRALGGCTTSRAGGCEKHLGAREPFDAVPFFWSAHYDLSIRYTGARSGGTL